MQVDVRVTRRYDCQSIQQSSRRTTRSEKVPGVSFDMRTGGERKVGSRSPRTLTSSDVQCL